MTKSLLIGVFFLGLQGVGYANLGDTEAQLVERYGAEIGSKSTDQPAQGAVALERVSFQKAGIVYQVSLFKGESSEESVFHRPYSEITDDEVKNLLAANAKGYTWKEIAPQPEFTTWLHALKSWRRSDGAIASLEGPKDRPRLLFHIKSKELITAENAANAKSR